MLHACPWAAGAYPSQKAPLLCLTVRVLCQWAQRTVQLAEMLLHDTPKGVLWVHLLIHQEACLREMLCCPLNQGIWPVGRLCIRNLVEGPPITWQMQCIFLQHHKPAIKASWQVAIHKWECCAGDSWTSPPHLRRQSRAWEEQKLQNCSFQIFRLFFLPFRISCGHQLHHHNDDVRSYLGLQRIPKALVSREQVSQPKVMYSERSLLFSFTTWVREENPSDLVFSM